MKPSEIYLQAAENLAIGQAQQFDFTCNEISNVAYTETVHKARSFYENIFSFVITDDGVYNSYELWSIAKESPETAREIRLNLLCLAAAMADAGDL